VEFAFWFYLNNDLGNAPLLLLCFHNVDSFDWVWTNVCFDVEALRAMYVTGAGIDD